METELRFTPTSASASAAVAIMLLVGLMLLSGCSNSLTRVQTWEGEAARDSEVALLQVPGAVRVLSVNGREMSRFLVDDMAVDYQLLAGNATVVFAYRTIWARPAGSGSRDARVDVVETAPQVMHFEARAGQVYRFDLPEVSGRREAEALAADFRASLLDDSGLRVADAEPWDTEALDRAPVPAAGEPQLDPVGQPADMTTRGASGASRLEQLQQLWGEASEQERREFLRWAFD